ncbi:hypothetical protein [Shimia sp.]|uniref:hypothetical protein n=1 Tax=Shimia sp. TaxID=1954381 RepID=UPI00329929FB
MTAQFSGYDCVKIPNPPNRRLKGRFDVLRDYLAVFFERRRKIKALQRVMDTSLHLLADVGFETDADRSDHQTSCLTLDDLEVEVFTVSQAGRLGD